MDNLHKALDDTIELADCHANSGDSSLTHHGRTIFILGTLLKTALADIRALKGNKPVAKKKENVTKPPRAVRKSKVVKSIPGDTIRSDAQNLVTTGN